MYVHPQWLPGETLFSLCSRIHHLAGGLSASETCSYLFAHPTCGMRHDFPMGLDRLVGRYRLADGGPEEIARRSTVLAYYLPLLDPSQEAYALSVILHQTDGSVKYLLGPLNAGFRAAHPLKICPECLKCDEVENGIAYWHLVHQLPGVWCCTKHRVLLHECGSTVYGAGRYAWQLPRGTPSQAVPFRRRIRSLTSPVLALAECTEGFANSERKLLPEKLTACYRHRLAEQGLAGAGGKLRHNEVGASLRRFFRGLEGMPGPSGTFTDPRKLTDRFVHLLWRYRLSTHPTRHLIVIAWLFGTWSSFEREYYSIDVA